LKLEKVASVRILFKTHTVYNMTIWPVIGKRHICSPAENTQRPARKGNAIAQQSLSALHLFSLQVISESDKYNSYDVTPASIVPTPLYRYSTESPRDVIRNDPSNYRSGPCRTECRRLTDRTTGTWYLCRRLPPTHSPSPPERASGRMIAGRVTDILKTAGARSRRRPTSKSPPHPLPLRSRRTKRRPSEVAAIEWLDAICDATGARLLQQPPPLERRSRRPVDRGRCPATVTASRDSPWRGRNVTSFTHERSATNRQTSVDICERWTFFTRVIESYRCSIVGVALRNAMEVLSLKRRHGKFHGVPAATSTRWNVLFWHNLYM